MKHVVVALALSLLAEGASPQSGYSFASAYGAARAAPVRAPDQMIRQGIDRLTGFIIGARDASPEAIRAFLDHEIAPSFDFAYMSRWAAGPLYRRMDETQHARLTDRVHDLFLGALARNLGSFNRPLPRIEVLAARPGRSAAETVVPARVALDSGIVARLEFRCYWAGSGWRVFDVAANGASALAYYRRHFGDLLRRHGPDALLD